ncbi:MAG: FeoB-associated Cys-rich membrane protein, partial [Campylobacterota bacterium]|nr:FeoB-associated Cys-rich membrane protein [Campylobacterota bacterium]
SDRFIYKYSFNTNITQEQNNNLDIKFKDKENYFLFNFNQQNLLDKSQVKSNEFIELLSKILKNFTNNIKGLLDELDKSNSFQAYIWLLFFSFAYGVIHAIGPGHGKSLISSYFLAQDSSHLKALGMASLIGVVHTFSAFILTFVIYYSVNSFLGSYFDDVEAITTKISAIIIIAIALFLIYKKIEKHKSNCGCGGCKTHSTDIGVILSAGIVPCAGTVTIFIYTMSLNLYFIGFLSAVFMSLGMSLIIYITALLSIKIRDKASSNTTLIKFFEYGSLVFILSLGVILLIV